MVKASNFNVRKFMFVSCGVYLYFIIRLPCSASAKSWLQDASVIGSLSKMALFWLWPFFALSWKPTTMYMGTCVLCSKLSSSLNSLAPSTIPCDTVRLMKLNSEFFFQSMHFPWPNSRCRKKEFHVSLTYHAKKLINTFAECPIVP